MNILLTNDDGVSAKGIRELYKCLKTQHSVYIIAPDEEKSACSNAITTRGELLIKRIQDNIFSVTGFPADCVNIGLHGELIPDVDIVISGINHGPNVGNDVVFSGTVAGARTAYIFGKSGIAVSIDSYHKPSNYFNEAASFILNFIEEDTSELKKRNVFLNINYPNLPKKSINGYIYTFLGNRIYRDSFKTSDVSESLIKAKLSGVFDYEYIHGSDVSALKDGFVSITPMGVDTTDKSYPQLHQAGTNYAKYRYK